MIGAVRPGFIVRFVGTVESLAMLILAVGFMLAFAPMPAAMADNSQGQAIVNAAAAQAGRPYCFDGGNTGGPTHGSGGSGCGGSIVGFDCTGLTLYAVFRATGKVLSHDGKQATEGGQVISNPADLLPGDLVFFGGTLNSFEHSGVYAGNNTFWDANDYNVPVQERTMAWEEHGLPFVGGVRYWSVSGGGGGTPPAPSYASGATFVGNWDGVGGDTIGAVHRESTGMVWYLRNYNSAGHTSITPFAYGGGDPTWTPVTGNWDGVGGDTIGAVHRESTGMVWYLRNYNSAGHTSITPFAYGGGDPTWTPVVGNWDGVGGDTIGAVHRESTGMVWYLRNYNSAGHPSVTPFAYGGGDPSWTPITGNWDGVGGDTIGAVHRESTGMVWYLRNYNSAGHPSVTPFAYGGGDPSWTPVVGDWDGNGTTTIGAVHREGSGLVWFLRNSNTPGPPDVIAFSYGGSDPSWVAG